MHDIHTHCKAFELGVTEKKKQRKTKQKEKKMNKIEMFLFGFLDLVNVLRNLYSGFSKNTKGM